LLVVRLGDIEVVGDAAPGQPDVPGLTGHPSGAVEQGHVDGESLRLVAGHRVSVVEVTYGPADRQGQVSVVVGPQAQCRARRVNRYDLRPAAVEQATTMVVGPHEDQVAGTVL